LFYNYLKEDMGKVIKASPEKELAKVQKDVLKDLFEETGYTAADIDQKTFEKKLDELSGKWKNRKIDNKSLRNKAWGDRI